jgi:hypothetical protein
MPPNLVSKSVSLGIVILILDLVTFGVLQSVNGSPSREGVLVYVCLLPLAVMMYDKLTQEYT